MRLRLEAAAGLWRLPQNHHPLQDFPLVPQLHWRLFRVVVGPLTNSKPVTATPVGEGQGEQQGHENVRDVTGGRGRGGRRTFALEIEQHHKTCTEG